MRHLIEILGLLIVLILSCCALEACGGSDDQIVVAEKSVQPVDCGGGLTCK